MACCNECAEKQARSPRVGAGSPRVGDDGSITGGFDTPQNRAAITSSARAAALAVQTGKAPTYDNYKAVVVQGLVTAATFAPAVAPFVGAAVALFYGFEQAMKALPQAHGGGGAACPSNNCQWCGNFNIATDGGVWPPKDPSDPNWIRYGQTFRMIPGKVWGASQDANLPDGLDLNDFETFYVNAWKTAFELWMNCKLPVVSPRAILVGCVTSWNATRQGSPILYTSEISDKAGNDWGWRPHDGASLISEVLSKDFDHVDVVPSPGQQMVFMGTPPRYVGGLHKALIGMPSSPTHTSGSALGALSGLLAQATPPANAKAAAGLGYPMTPEARAFGYYVKLYTGKDYVP